MLAFNSIELMACNGVIIIATPNITAVIAFALRPWPHVHKYFLKTKPFLCVLAFWTNGSRY